METIRKRERDELNVGGINKKYLKTWGDDFKNDKKQIMTRNAIVSVGSEYACTNSEEAKKVNHIFINTLKKHNLKATNQGYSGRCWLFAGLNTFRHLLIKALDLDEFEFSETYLYFYDRLERSCYFLQWFIDHPEFGPESREAEFMLTSYLDDGGYWSMFANLVEKYGVVPKSAMPETFQSSYTDDMNAEINNYLTAAASKLQNKGKRLPISQCKDIKHNTLKLIFELLVKYLGHPPKDFVWFYTQHEEGNSSACRSNPKDFTSMSLSFLSMNDFVILSNFPCKTNQFYEVKYTSNFEGGKNVQFLNVPISELKRYVSKSISNHLPVWFSGDVTRGFSCIHQSLNNKVLDTSLVFEKELEIDKGERVKYLNSGGCHAMVFLGVNYDEKGNPVEWQVENSWGYWDHEERGMDGFLSMSNEWFEECVFMVVIHKEFLSRTLKRQSELPPILLEPWDSTAPAKAGPFIPPPREKLFHPKRRNMFG